MGILQLIGRIVVDVGDVYIFRVTLEEEFNM